MDETEENEINLTDRDARTVKFGAHQGTDVGYNVQAVVDEKNKLIATFEVSNFSSDKGYFDGSDIAKCYNYLCFKTCKLKLNW